jgi:hypothetical protein
LNLCTIIKQKHFFYKMRKNDEHIPGVPAMLASPVASPASDAPLAIQEAIHVSN